VSRRSAVQTLVRVAELKEAVARGEAARALRASREAGEAIDAARDSLRQAGLAGGSRAALESTTAVRLWRAEAVTVAEVAAAQLDLERQEAITAWVESRRRHRLFESLAARKHEERVVAQEKAEQALADELATSRGGDA
jgi:hypothetical protein